MKQRFLRQKSVHIDRKMKRSEIDFIKIKSCTTRVNKENHKKMSRQIQRKYVPIYFWPKASVENT